MGRFLLLLVLFSLGHTVLQVSLEPFELVLDFFQFDLLFGELSLDVLELVLRLLELLLFGLHDLCDLVIVDGCDGPG